MAAILFIVLPIAGGLYFGDVITPRDCWTPFRGIGAWRNEQAARKTLRLLHATGPSKFFPFTEWGLLSIHGPAPKPTRAA